MSDWLDLMMDEIARKASLTRKHSEVIVDSVFSSIIEALQEGDKIELRGFGSFLAGSRTGRRTRYDRRRLRPR